MKLIKKLTLSLLIISCFVLNVNAQVGLDKLAQSTMNFLLVSISPKASGMGEAYFANSSGALSMFYNPAGLVNTEKTFDVTLNYTQWIADISYLGGGVAYNMGDFGTVGVQLMTVDYGTINGTRLVSASQQGQYPAGFIETGEVGNVGAYSFGISYAKRINQRFSIGGNIRYVGQNLGTNQFLGGSSKDNNASKLVFDAGVIYDTQYKGFKFGMAIRNFASNIKREEIDEQLPLSFTVGTIVNLWDIIIPDHDASTSMNLAVDYLHSNSYSERLNFGLEYKFLDRIFLRGGYQTNRDIASWSGGIGVIQPILDYAIEINYSYSQMDIFDNVSRLSVGFQF